MSKPLVARALDLERLRDRSRTLVLVAICEDCDGEGRTFSGMARIAWRARQSERQAARHLDHLVAEGIVVVERASTGPGVERLMRVDMGRAEAAYGITDFRLVKAAARAARQGRKMSGVRNETGDKPTSNGRQIETERGTSCTQKPPEMSPYPSEPLILGSGDIGKPTAASMPDTGVPGTPAETELASNDGVADAERTSSNELLCTHWRSNRASIERVLGQAFYGSWLARLIPESDDGEILILSAPSRFVVDQLRTRLRVHVQKVEKLMGRKIEIEYRTFARAARGQAGR